MTKRLF
jgi:hypothetical protein